MQNNFAPTYEIDEDKCVSDEKVSTNEFDNAFRKQALITHTEAQLIQKGLNRRDGVQSDGKKISDRLNTIPRHRLMALEGVKQKQKQNTGRDRIKSYFAVANLR